MNDEAERLPAGIRETFARGKDDLLLSIASPWEIQIKQQIGKLSVSVLWR
jgi:PIN domain nuclease of toxin-antitoxin system